MSADLVRRALEYTNGPLDIDMPGGAGIWRVTGGRLSDYRLLGEIDREDALATLRSQAGM